MDIGHYGVYNNLTDSTFTEQIIMHSLNANMTGSFSKIKYKLLDSNNIIMEYNNDGQWIPEVWPRVVLPD